MEQPRAPQRDRIASRPSGLVRAKSRLHGAATESLGSAVRSPGISLPVERGSDTRNCNRKGPENAPPCRLSKVFTGLGGAQSDCLSPEHREAAVSVDFAASRVEAQAHRSFDAAQVKAERVVVVIVTGLARRNQRGHHLPDDGGVLELVSTGARFAVVEHEALLFVVHALGRWHVANFVSQSPRLAVHSVHSGPGGAIHRTHPMCR
jgi:hypothetical protein